MTKNAAETLTGRCHCGAIKFEVSRQNKIQLCRCDCSICSKKGIVVFNVPIENFKLTQGQESLSVYQWNTQIAKHYFCKNCGVHTHNFRRSITTETGINCACIDNYDFNEFKEIQILHGSRHSLI